VSGLVLGEQSVANAGEHADDGLHVVDRVLQGRRVAVRDADQIRELDLADGVVGRAYGRALRGRRAVDANALARVPRDDE